MSTSPTAALLGTQKCRQGYPICITPQSVPQRDAAQKGALGPESLDEGSLGGALGEHTGSQCVRVKKAAGHGALRASSIAAGPQPLSAEIHHARGQSSLILDHFLAAKALHHREVVAEFLAGFPDVCFVFKNLPDVIALEVLPTDKRTDRDVE